MKKVLILCTGNSCRSQIAQGFLDTFTNESVQVYSAGIETHGVNTNAIETMKEEGIDISNHTSNHIDEYSEIKFDYIITVCDSAKEKCPYFPSNAIKFHQSFKDPAQIKGTEEEIKDGFALVRNDIKRYCKEFATAYLR